MTRHLRAAVLSLLIISSLGWSIPARGFDCLWSFNTISHRVHKRSPASDIFKGNFPQRFFIIKNTIYIFDSNGSFMKSITVRSDQRVGAWEREKVMFVRDDVPMIHEGVRGPVQLLDSVGDTLCSTIRAVDVIIPLDHGRRYFQSGGRFGPPTYCDSCLSKLADLPGYHTSNFAIVEGKRRIVLVASGYDFGHFPPWGSELFLICTDYDGNVIWTKSISNVVFVYRSVQANSDFVVLCYKDASSRELLSVFDVTGNLIHTAVLSFEPKAISNIQGTTFAVLQEARSDLFIHLYSAATLQSDTLKILRERFPKYPRVYSIDLFKGQRLMLTTVYNYKKEWGYRYFDEHHSLLDSKTIRQPEKPNVVVVGDRIMLFRISKRSICLGSY
jgi:hypothetical protein